jgi:hypothetical protein
VIVSGAIIVGVFVFPHFKVFGNPDNNFSSDSNIQALPTFRALISMTTALFIG